MLLSKRFIFSGEGLEKDEKLFAGEVGHFNRIIMEALGYAPLQPFANRPGGYAKLAENPKEFNSVLKIAIEDLAIKLRNLAGGGKRKALAQVASGVYEFLKNLHLLGILKNDLKRYLELVIINEVKPGNPFAQHVQDAEKKLAS